MLASNGVLYGTTSSGSQGLDTFFKITPGGTLTTLSQFGPGIGAVSTLIQADNGTFRDNARGNQPGHGVRSHPSGTSPCSTTFARSKTVLMGPTPLAHWSKAQRISLRHNGVRRTRHRPLLRGWLRHDFRSRLCGLVVDRPQIRRGDQRPVPSSRADAGKRRKLLRIVGWWKQPGRRPRL